MKSFVAGVLTGVGVLLAGGQVHDALKTQRFPQFENDSVRVWRTVIAPHSRTEMHRHDHARVAVAMSSGTITFVDDHGAREDHVWEAGKAYWLTAMASGATHADVNDGAQPIEVMMVELEKE